MAVLDAALLIAWVLTVVVLMRAVFHGRSHRAARTRPAGLVGLPAGVVASGRGARQRRPFGLWGPYAFPGAIAE